MGVKDEELEGENSSEELYTDIIREHVAQLYAGGIGGDEAIVYSGFWESFLGEINPNASR